MSFTIQHFDQKNYGIINCQNQISYQVICIFGIHSSNAELIVIQLLKLQIKLIYQKNMIRCMIFMPKHNLDYIVNKHQYHKSNWERPLSWGQNQFILDTEQSIKIDLTLLQIKKNDQSVIQLNQKMPGKRSQKKSLYQYLVKRRSYLKFPLKKEQEFKFSKPLSKKQFSPLLEKILDYIILNYLNNRTNNKLKRDSQLLKISHLEDRNRIRMLIQLEVQQKKKQNKIYKADNDIGAKREMNLYQY
ncbi:unnamed protein product [Paramecium primaurelia]|uniref:Uncharacterized protein n=1 Tax=Paramecium primaurelia TaxID=5886 RepID=A0A8S1NLE2_PARPR|nr:unnamed protein product [Paramecium primaurelia]